MNRPSNKEIGEALEVSNWFFDEEPTIVTQRLKAIGKMPVQLRPQGPSLDELEMSQTFSLTDRIRQASEEVNEE